MDWLHPTHEMLEGRHAGQADRQNEINELEALVACLEAENTRLREALEEIASGQYGKSIAVKNIARAALAKEES